MQGFHFLPLCLALLLRTPHTIAVQVTSIRLMNGSTVSSRVGRVEIQVDNNGTWGSICDDGWDNREAIVVCRSLGFINGGVAVTDTRYGTGSFDFLMDDSACTGDESSLSECLSSQISDCSRATDTEAGVECNMNLGPGQPTPAPTTTSTAPPSVISGNCQTTPTVRLTGKQGVNGIGYVEAQQPNGIWGFVCDDGWSSQAAKIVCAQMCYPTNYTAKPGIPAELKPTIANPIVVLDDVNCFGNETTLQNCAHSPWGVTDCLTTDVELAGVQCVAAPYLPPPAPVPVLICGQGKMTAQFSRAQDPSLEVKHLSVLSQPDCPDVTKNTTNQYVIITIPVNKCGTITSSNGTHIIYYNEVKYDSTSTEGQGSITRVNTYRVQITCVLPVNLNVTQRVEPVTQAVTQIAVGNFDVWLTIYRNDSFNVAVTENPVKIPLGEYLYMVVSMDDYDPNLKLVVTNCIATPTGDVSGNGKKVLLISDKCSNESTLTFYPLSNFRFGFRFKPFKFVGFDILYIYCESIICLASDNTRECDRTCGNSKPNVTTTAASSGRKRRSSNISTASAVSQAIIVEDSHTSGSNTENSNDNKNDNTNIVVVPDQPPMFQNSSTRHEATTSNLKVSTSSSLQGVLTTPKSKYEKETTLQFQQSETTVTKKSLELQSASPLKKDPHSASEGGNGGHRISLCSVLVFVLCLASFLYKYVSLTS